MVVPSHEVGPASRLLARLRAFETYCAGSVVPPGFEAYCRILHPAEDDGGRPVRWATIARWAGRVYHPAMQFEAIARPRPNFGASPAPWNGQLPRRLPMDQVVALATTLKPFTRQAEHIWYLVWEGYGGAARSRAFAERPHRRYLVYRGDLTDNRDFYAWNRSPADYWFPQDEAWCVASDVDLCWTYVGGTRRCVEAILRCPDLEAVPVDLDQGLTVDSDELNPLSPDEPSPWG